jgi:predicted O-methyltransferase YrrM
MTALIDTLFMMESFLGIEADTLLPFAQADNIGGYHPDPAQRQWGSGAIWDVEGRIIYALIRALKPVNVVEIGSGTGCSTTHIASALSHNYPLAVGSISTIDRGNTPQIPDDVIAFVTIFSGDAIEWLQQQPDNSIDFMLEDADHSEAMCYRVGELAKTKLAPGGVLLAHDAAHFGVGADVRAGFTRAGLQYRVYLTEPSDCGFMVWRKDKLPEGARLQPDGSVVREYNQTEQDHIRIQNGGYAQFDSMVADSLADTEPVLQAQEDKPKRKRKPARKAAK